MDAVKANATLTSLTENVEQLFHNARTMGAEARANLARVQPEGDCDDAERRIFHGVQELGRQLFAVYFKELGTGDQGYTIERDGVVYERKHTAREVGLQSVFGEVNYRQSEYYSGAGQSLRPIEAMANLPENRVSYFAQDLMSRLGMQDSYEGSRRFYADFFGHSPSPNTVQESILALARSSESYERETDLPRPDAEGAIGVNSFDGKGVRVVPEQRTSGKTREALVGCTYTIEPQVRTAEEVALSLVPLPGDEEQSSHARKRPNGALAIQYRGSVLAAKEEVFEQAADYARERFSAAGITTTVNLIDGAPVLGRLCEEHFSDAVCILDIIHVLGYLWDAAKALDDKPEEQRPMVRAWLTVILQGGVGRVVGSMKIRLAKNKLSKKRREALQTSIGYLHNHRQFMAYDEYLANGYPIGTGVIESACRHIVKDRLDKGGACWTLEGADAMIKLRCIKASNHWHQFVAVHKQRERERLYAAFLDPAA